MKLFKFSRRSIVVAALVATIVIGFVSVIGWQYRTKLKYKGTVVYGTVVIPTDQLLDRVSIPEGTRLYSVNIDSIGSHIEAHPWVESAEVRRLATGKIKIRITERMPVVVVAVNGVPNHYLDRSGFRLPLADGFAFDVPVLTGRLTSYTSAPSQQRLSNATLRELLNALSVVDEKTLSLVSEIDATNDAMISVRTTPVEGRGSIPVILGSSDFERKLIRLEAFWQQVILRKPDETVRKIDLRYDNQILTT